MSDTTMLVANAHEAIELLQTALSRDDVVLVKASRAVGLETVAMAISELRT